jgi:hypothetical protein
MLFAVTAMLLAVTAMLFAVSGVHQIYQQQVVLD